MGSSEPCASAGKVGESGNSAESTSVAAWRMYDKYLRGANEHRGVARTAPLIYLMPVVAGLSAWAFTGERFTLHKVLAATVVLAGVAVAQFGHRPPKVADASGD